MDLIVSVFALLVSLHPENLTVFISQVCPLSDAQDPPQVDHASVTDTWTRTSDSDRTCSRSSCSCCTYITDDSSDADDYTDTDSGDDVPQFDPAHGYQMITMPPMEYNLPARPARPCSPPTLTATKSKWRGWFRWMSGPKKEEPSEGECQINKLSDS